MNELFKTYFVVYKLFQKPGLGHLKVLAENKAEARMRFLESNVKHDCIVRVLTDFML